MTKRSHVEDLRGATRLAVEATRSVVDVVEAMHRAIGPTLLSGLVYGSIRGVTGLVGAGIDGALAQLAPLLGESAPGAERTAVLAALNGVLGDYLADTGNPLAQPMLLARGGQPVEPEALPAAATRAVLIHGSSLDDRAWLRKGHDHGAALERDLGLATVYVRYNSGLHVSTNGRALAALLERVPGRLLLVGHSMGGLVARSACHVAEQGALGWRRRTAALVTLGSPHHGAPLERGGNWIDLLLGVHPYSAPIGRLARVRSAGVTDLRFGNVRDEDWQGRDRFAHGADRRVPLPLPEGVACHAIAASRSAGPGARLRGDGLVPVASALGEHARPELRLAFPEANRFIAYRAGHLDLLDRADVYERLRGWLA